MSDAPDAVQRRVILLLGSPRSGTTWLAKILDSHRGVVYSHEPFTRLHHRLGPLIDQMKTGRMPAPQRTELIRELCKAYFTSRRPPFFAKDFSCPPLFLKHLVWVVAEATPWAGGWYRRLFSPSERAQYDLLLKEVNWAKHASAIVGSLDPELILIVRHPCAVVSSLDHGRRLGLMPDQERRSWFAEHEPLCEQVGFDCATVEELSEYEFAALDWMVQNLAYLNVLKEHPRSHLVVYEDLCKDPPGVSQGVFDFLGWQLGPQTSRFLQDSTRGERLSLPARLRSKFSYFGVFKDPVKSSEGWKRKLTEPDKERVMAILQSFPVEPGDYEGPPVVAAFHRALRAWGLGKPRPCPLPS